MATIGIYRKMVPSDWYITAPDDEKTRLNFSSEEDAKEARAFMEKVFAAGKSAGEKYMANQMTAMREVLRNHIGDCEHTLSELSK